MNRKFKKKLNFGTHFFLQITFIVSGTDEPSKDEGIKKRAVSGQLPQIKKKKKTFICRFLNYFENINFLFFPKW